MVPALLIIDALNDFLDPAGALFCGADARAILPVIRSLRDHFQRQHQPVFYLCDAHRPDDLEFQLFPAHAVKGTWGGRIVPELDPVESSQLIEKTRFSCFYRTPLAARLEQAHIQEVRVTGVCTSICVMDTVGDLRNRDYPVRVVENAVADFDPTFHEFALVRMERVYGAKRVLWRDPAPGAHVAY